MVKKIACQPGDVYATRLKDGKRGAIRILKIGPLGPTLAADFYLTVVTPYVGQEAPTIDDPALRAVLRRKRCSGKGEPCIGIYGGKLHKTLEYIGTFGVTSEEEKLNLKIGTGLDGGYPLHGTMDDNIGQEALYEWRWEHDRDAFQREIDELHRANKKALAMPVAPRARIRGAKLDETQFWNLIASIDATAEDEEEALKPLVEGVSRLSMADICEFEEILTEKLYALDGEKYADKAGRAGKSGDAFLYARCYVVGQGKEFYDSVLADPSKFPADADLEALLSVSENAYEKKSGRSLDHSTHYSYETGSNSEGWPTAEH